MSTKVEVTKLSRAMDDCTYICDALMSNFCLSGPLKDAAMQLLHCYCPVEKTLL